MKRLKSLRFLIVTAVAVVAFAAPAVASAHEWTHEGNPIEEDTQVALTGWSEVSPSVNSGPVICPIQAELTLEAGTETATVNSWSVGPVEECIDWGPLYYQCEIVAAEATPPSAIHIIDGEHFEIEGVNLHVDFTGCSNGMPWLTDPGTNLGVLMRKNAWGSEGSGAYHQVYVGEWPPWWGRANIGFNAEEPPFGIS